MTILIIYSTIEGQTGKIVQAIHTNLQKAGHDVRIADAGNKTLELSFDGVDKVILAAPVHERRHPKPFELLVTADAAALKARQTLMVSVSLKAAFAETREEAQDFLDEMKLRTGLEPDAEMLVAGAVHPGYYDYYAEQILRHVILQGQDVDPHTEHEFTDWQALEAGVTAFVTA
ncbi:MAG: flavodoxin domain-containing protein [Roseovarius sp.]